MKSKKNILYITGTLFALAAFLFLLLFSYHIRSVIFSFVENCILHRVINHPDHWTKFLEAFGCFGCIISLIISFSLFFPSLAKKGIRWLTESNERIVFIFSIGIIIFFVVSNIYLMINPDKTKGFYNIFDYGDHFVSLFQTKDRHLSDYPPFAEFLYRSIASMIPLTIMNNASCFQNIAFTYEGNYVLLLYFLTVLIPLVLLCTRAIDGTGKVKVLFAFAVSLSSVSIFTLQRGNIILLALDLTVYFCIAKDSQNTIIRETSLIALAAAFGLKIYPAVFGAVLLSQKRWKESIRAALYGILFFFVPLFFYNNGIREISNLIDGLSNLSSNISNYNFSLHSNTALFLKHFNVPYPAFRIIYRMLLIIYISISTWLFCISEEDWQKYILLSLAVILIPGVSWPYAAFFYLIPLISVLNTGKKDIFKMLVIVLFFIAFVYERIIIYDKYINNNGIFSMILFMITALSIMKSYYIKKTYCTDSETN